MQDDETRLYDHQFLNDLFALKTTLNYAYPSNLTASKLDRMIFIPEILGNHNRPIPSAQRPNSHQPPTPPRLFQFFECLRSNTMIHAMQQVEVPSLAIALTQFGDAFNASVVRLYLGGTVLLTGCLKGGKMIDYLFFRLIFMFYAFRVCFHKGWIRGNRNTIIPPIAECVARRWRR